VPRAAVFAINANDIAAEVNDAEAYAELAEECGHFIGWTDRSGKVVILYPGKFGG